MASASEGDGSFDEGGVLDAVGEQLLRQHRKLTRAVDDEVLQYACGALQDLHEIHRAQPHEPLWRAIGNLHHAITHLRSIVEQQPAVDADVRDRLEQLAPGRPETAG